MKKIALFIAGALLTAPAMTACGTQQDEYVGVCVDPQTEVRLDDDACDRGDSDFLTGAVIWYMLANSSHSYPGYGDRVNRSYFKTSKPKGAYVYKKSLPAKGGKNLSSYTSKSKSFGGSKSSWGTGGSKSNSGSKSGGWGSGGSKSGGTSGGFKSGGTSGSFKTGR